MVRTKTLPFESWARATPGQITWVYVNDGIDWDERLKRTHTGDCRKRLTELHCEVCGKPIADEIDLPDEIREKIYRPSDNEVIEVEYKAP